MIDVSGKRVTILGLGIHGGQLGAAIWFLEQGARIHISEAKPRQGQLSSIRSIEQTYRRLAHSGKHSYRPTYRFDGHAKEDIINADLVVASPGVARDSWMLTLARLKHIPVRIGDTTLFMEYVDAPIIGVTGTKGKTTTTTLIGAMLQKVDPNAIIAGNLRVSPLKYIVPTPKKLQAKKLKSSCVLELSSWQLEGLTDIKKSPSIAVITNISPDHLNRYKSYRDYQKAKELIFKYQQSTDAVILNHDNDITRRMIKSIRSQPYWFSLHELKKGDGSFIRSDNIIFQKGRNEHVVCRVSDIRLNGDHNLSNALAAVTATMVVGVPINAIRSVLRSFNGVADRQEVVRIYKHITYINDTTATAPAATIAALKRFASAKSGAGRKKKNIILIAGGMDKDLDYKELAREIPQYIKALILFQGTASDKLQKELKHLHKKGYSLLTTHYSLKTMHAALSKARSVAQAGDVVLLSPGAASFGLFKNEFDRGAQFVKEVKKIK